MKSYIFNHDYILRHDQKRTYIAQKYSNNKSSKKWKSIIHPVQAMILSFFSEPKTFDEVISDLEYFLDLNEKEVKKIIKPFIKNKTSFIAEYDEIKFLFPENVLIDAENNKSAVIVYEADKFTYNELDFETARMFSGPLYVTFMLNNKCVTDCIYCYADKSNKAKELSFERIKELIDEAKKMNALEINICGGEVLLYPQWEKLLNYLIKENGYMPEVISTKVPLCQEDVIKLKNTGINKIQISLDTLIEKNLTHLLKTSKEYKKKIMDFIKFLDKENFDIDIQTVITKYNCSEKDILSVFNFIKQFKNIKKWSLRPSFPSLYNGNDFIPSINQLNKVYDYTEPLKSQIDLMFDKPSTATDKYASIDGAIANFSPYKCTANLSHIFVLPDGKVTTCEQLYWNPLFIVGDLKTQSIDEVWNSEKSLWLANIQKSELSEQSPCKSCETFDSCFKNLKRCWLQVIKTYGNENWDYPDPRCKLAPELKTNIFYK